MAEQDMTWEEACAEAARRSTESADTFFVTKRFARWCVVTELALGEWTVHMYEKGRPVAYIGQEY